MNRKLLEALDIVESMNWESAVIATPFAVTFKDVLALREHPRCKGLVVPTPSDEITSIATCGWLGWFEDYGWRLPVAEAPIIFLGSQLMLTRKMAIQVVKSRRSFVVCKVNGRYQQLFMHRFLLWRAGEKLIHIMGQQPEWHPLRKAVVMTREVSVLRTLWRRIFKREALSSSRLSCTGQNANAFIGEPLYKELLQRARASAHERGYQPIPRRVVLVNAGLAAGGAERQIVNTLIGLQRSGQCESVSLLAEYIDHAPNLDFFLHELEMAGIEVRQVEHTVSLGDDGLSSVDSEVAELLADISPGLIEEILNLVEEFRSRRPEVIHAWQDSSSIKAGIAAMIAGVPRIVLASRNVTPTNFTYYQDYMCPAYRALASMDCVAFLNNSEAGATDYTRWLGLPRERFTVVRNGVDLGYLKRVAGDSVREYRQSLGIPENALVVGSIFRFWEEKRPMLWLHTAALVATCYPDVHFLVIGEGPMRREMESFISNHGLKRRVHLPGARPEVATSLSIMDVFLLTSEFEGTPNVVLEAQWLGLPIVATDAGGTKESFSQGETGLLAALPSAERLAALVGIYLDNDRMREQAIEAGPRFVAQDFGMQQMIDKTLELYGIRTSQFCGRSH
ncbi:MAG: glycosyltransferase [Nitrospira sp.]|nr:glycosyltransferase [Nitrospira sp.]